MDNIQLRKILLNLQSELSENIKQLPSYIKDTTDFFLKKLQSIEQPLPPETIMFCFDVKALYPSVPRNETRNACRIALDKRTNPKLPTEDTLKLIETVLENNIFHLMTTLMSKQKVQLLDLDLA